MRMANSSFLQKGMKIGVMAPSSYVEEDDIDAARLRLEQSGYSVFIHPQTFERDGQSAGSILQKSLALQGLWCRDDIDAIWFAGGGNQSLPLLKALNFETMGKVRAKPVLGFSDCTTLINALPFYCHGTAWHAPVFKQIASRDDFDLIMDVLEGNSHNLPFSTDQILTAGDATGSLVGGNFSLLQYLPSLFGLDYFKDTILFLEDHGEEMSRIDRMFSFLSASGVFDQISGLMLGQFSNAVDTGRPFGKDLDQIIETHCGGYNFPVIKNLPFGHVGNFFPLPIGFKAFLSSQGLRLR